MRAKKAKKWVGMALAALTGWGLIGGGQAVLAEPARVVITAPPQDPAPAITSEDVNTWLDGVVPAHLNQGQIPGAIVTVVKDGQVVTTRGYGWADVASNTPVTPNTLFRVGSISKIPTTITALNLVEQGVLDLDADISTYVDVPIDRSFEEPITLRNLLTHTAGFEERYGFISGKFEENATFPLAEDVLTDPPAQIYRPGSTPAYSNYGMALVGYIIEQVTGKPYEQAVEETVLQPAGMQESTYRQPFPAGIAQQMATGYVTTGEEGRGFETISTPDGALTSSGSDMAKFMIAQLGGTVLSPELQRLAWQPGLPTTFGGDHMGLGYFISARNGHKTVSHGGDVSYFHSLMELYPEENMGVFVSVNGDGDPAAAGDLRATISHGFAERYLPGDPTPTTPDPEAIHRAEGVAGRYEQSRTIDSNVASLLADLMVTYTLSPAGDGGLLLDGEVYYRQISPWVWQDPTESVTIAADPRGESLNLTMGAANTLLPTTGKHAFTTYGGMAGLVCLLLALLAWPLGAWRRMSRLTWVERIARLGPIAIAVALGCLYQLTLNTLDISLPLIRTTQAFMGLGALAIIPATWALVQSVRTRAGWPRILSNTILVVGLVLMAAVFGIHHFFSLDVSL